MILPRKHVWLLVDQGLVSGTAFLTTVLLVRRLGLERFGTYGLVWLGVLLAIGLQQALVGQPLLTIAPKLAGTEREREYRGATLVLAAGFSAVVLALSGGAYWLAFRQWGGGELDGCLLPAVLAATSRQAQAYTRSVLFSREQRMRVLAIDAVTAPGQLVALYLLGRAGRLDIATALWVVSAASCIACVAGLVGHPWRTSRAALRDASSRHWRFARWLAAMQLIQFGASNAFVVAAGALLGTGAVGSIKAAQGVIGVLHVGLLAMENLVPVSAARLYLRGGYKSLTRYLVHVGRVGLGSTALVAATLALAARPVLGLIYGAESGPQLETALRAFAVLYLFAFSVTLLQIGFRTLERTRPVFLCYATTTLVALASAEPLVRRLGFLGAVGGMAGLQALMTLLLFLAFRMAGKRDLTTATSSSA